MSYTNHKAVRGQNFATQTAVTADDTAGQIDLDFSSITEEDIVGFIVNVYRAGVDVKGDAVVSATGTTLTVADGSTYAVTAGDIVHAIVY